MRIIRVSNEEIQKMKEFFEERTEKHIKRVKKYADKIFHYDPARFDDLPDQVKDHDQSKYEDPEIDPYIYITWQYKCKDEGKDFELPDGMEERMNKATEHHVKSNRHHPEFHCEKEVDLINRGDRDKPPKEIIDATKMNDTDVAEMCSDWFAMAEEKGTDPKDWADKNVGVRWKFSDRHEKIIYELIENVWEG